jgi:hypothetical protein
VWGWLGSLAAGGAKEVVENFTSGIRGIITTFKMPPEEAAKFEQAMSELAYKMVSGSLELAQRSQDSARQREIAVKDNTPRVLTYTYTGMFILLMLFNAYLGISHTEITGYAQRSFDQFTGVLFAFVTSSKEYYLGTSMSEVSAWATDKWQTLRGGKQA